MKKKIMKGKRSLLALILVMTLIVSYSGITVFGADDIDGPVNVTADEYNGNMTYEYGNVTSEDDYGLLVEASGGHAAEVKVEGSVTADLDGVMVSVGESIENQPSKADVSIAGGINFGDHYADHYPDGIGISNDGGIVNVTVGGNIVGGEGADDGVDVYTKNGGQTTVTINGNIDSDYGLYPYVYGQGSREDITVLGNITAEDHGIYGADVTDGAEQNITIKGSIESTYDDGIYVDDADGEGTKQTITVEKGITAGEYGIYVDDVRDGAEQNITVGGDITAGETGIYTYYTQNGAEQNINVGGDITAGETGIYTEYVRYGAEQNITVGGDITAEESGIYVYDLYDEAKQNITVTGNIVAGEYGIYSDDVYDRAEQNITVGGDVDAQYDGIYVGAYYEGTSQTISVGGSITAGETGIGAYAYDGANQTITVTGDITSSESAINTYSDYEAKQNITVGGDVIGEEYGIYARSEDYAETVVDVAGNVEGAENGIKASVYSEGNLSITVGSDVIGGVNGVVVGPDFMYGPRSVPYGFVSGNIDVTVLGNVEGGEHGSGIEVFAGYSNNNINVVENVTGDAGIAVLQNTESYNPNRYFVQIENPDDVEGWEINFEDEENIYIEKDGTIIPLALDFSEWGVRVLDEEGNQLNIATYSEEGDGEILRAWVLKDAPEPVADTTITIGGDVTGNRYGLVVGSTAAIPLMADDVVLDDSAIPSEVLTDVVIEGTLSGQEAAIVLQGNMITEENLHLTVWAVTPDEEGNLVKAMTFGEEEIELVANEATKALEESIRYIIKIEQPEVGAMLTATNSEGDALETSHDFDVAVEGEKVLLKINLEEGYKLLGAYNGLGERVPLIIDEDGNYYVVVPKGGGVYLSAEIEKEKYNVQFVNYNDEVLQSSIIEYGETPTYNGETPTKPETQEKVFTFAGWTPEIDKVTGEITYKATFTEEAHPYDIYMDYGEGEYNGQTGLVKLNCKYGDKITLPAPTREGYEFLYWQGSIYYAGDVYTVTGGHTLTAIWEEVKAPAEEKTDPKEEEKTDPKEEEKTDPKEEQKTDPKEEEKTDPKEEQKTDPKEEQKTEPKEEQKTEPKEEQKTEEKAAESSVEKATAKTTASDSTPPTGDNENIVLWVTMICVSMYALPCALKRRFR